MLCMPRGCAAHLPAASMIGQEVPRSYQERWLRHVGEDPGDAILDDIADSADAIRQARESRRGGFGQHNAEALDAERRRVEIAARKYEQVGPRKQVWKPLIGYVSTKLHMLGDPEILRQLLEPSAIRSTSSDCASD